MIGDSGPDAVITSSSGANMRVNGATKIGDNVLALIPPCKKKVKNYILLNS